jgi:hypothetical protein
MVQKGERSTGISQLREPFAPVNEGIEKALQGTKELSPDCNPKVEGFEAVIL